MLRSPCPDYRITDAGNPLIAQREGPAMRGKQILMTAVIALGVVLGYDFYKARNA